MKGIILIGSVIVIAFLILGVPAFSYGSTKMATNELRITVTAYVSAPFPGAQDPVASYSVSSSYSGNYSRPGYFDYIGQFWGKSLHMGQAFPDYPFVTVVIAKRTDLANGGYRLDRIIPDEYIHYEFGTHFSKIYKIPVYPGEKLHVQVQIAKAQSTDFGYYGQDIKVPTGV